MYFYYLNATVGENGEHEVHKSDCSWLSLIKNKVNLGLHRTCESAITKAKSLGYSTADGCEHCSPDCHNI